MIDRTIREALHHAAGGVVLPERFNRPSHLVQAAARRRRKFRLLVTAMAAGVLALVTTAGLTAAAGGGLLSRYHQYQNDAQQLLATVREVDESAGEIGSLSLSYPVQSPQLADRYGWRKDPVTGENGSLHAGVDFATPVGEQVIAAADGVVAAAGAYKELGNVVVISHGKVDGKAISTWYLHNGKLRVKVGQDVKRGDVIALAGTTGLSTGPHVHFEVRTDGEPVDPRDWLER